MGNVDKAVKREEFHDELESKRWLGTEILSYGFCHAGQTKGVKGRDSLRTIILKAGGRVTDEINAGTILLCGESGIAATS